MCIRDSSGTASADYLLYELSITPDATFKPTLLDGIGDYDGSPAAKLKYTTLFSGIGLYFVTSVTTGGSYLYTSTITKSSKSSSSQFASEFKAQVAFVSASGGGSSGSSSDEFHSNEDLTVHLEP